jgi:hypothetical protein
MRSHDAKLVAEIVAYLLKEERANFDAIEWVSNPGNILLVDGQDAAIFHQERPGVVNGHYYFKSRGRQAITVGKRLLGECFSLGVQTVMGTTPLVHLGARWMTRQLGLKSHGIVHTSNGPHELFIMHYSEYSL